MPLIHSDDAPALLLSPHLDDAVLSAWSVLTGPGEVQVVNFCAAAPPEGVEGRWDRVTGARDSRSRMRERVAEDAEALALAGRTPVNLSFLDGQYRDGRPPAGDGELREALLGVAPRASALYAPAGIGGHVDHVPVRELALSLARESGTPLWLYADVPYAVRSGWPHWVTGAQPRPNLLPEERWREFLDTASCPLDARAAEVHELSEEECERKLRAIETYRTQAAALNAGPLERLRHPEVLPFEVRWAVSEPG